MIFFLFLIVWVFVFTKFSYLQRKRRKLAKVKDIEKQRIDVKWMMNKNEIMQQDKISYELWLKAKVNYERSNMKKKEKFFQWIVFDGVAFLNTLSVIIIVGVSWWLLHIWYLTYWEITVVVGFGSMFIKETTQLLKSIRSMIDRYIDVVKIQELCKELKSSVDIHSWLSFTYKSWNIKIYNMSFWYEKSPVFQNFNLQIQGWTKTAFVGESWGGKTTLIKLLAGYIRPDSGEIEIDGQKLSEIKLTDYYKHIGYLTQDPSVFDGTMYENLVYALDIEPPKEDLEKVVKLAKCEFIREFEKWLETEIGERWVRLSWWQKQRLAIAKIMLKNPNIILLDEPTSALDSFNEELINIALHNLFKGKTVIVVAHRLQTVKQADRILLFEQGKILEEWTHNELVKLNGKYKKMLDLQSWF